MKERGEPHIPVLPRHLAHTIQITGHALLRHCVRGAFHWPCSPRAGPFPPPPPPPEPRACSAASQVLRACLTSRDRASRDYRLSVPLTARQALDLPPREPSRTGHHQHPRATTGSPGSRAWSSSCVPGFFDRAGSTSDSRKRRQQCCLPPIGRASAPRTTGITRLNSPARTPPINASLRPHGTPTHDSGPPRIATPST